MKDEEIIIFGKGPVDGKLKDALKKAFEDYFDEDKTYCTVCNKEMSEGYVVNDGLENYCSKECLNTKITDDEYKQLYEEGYAYWTTFED